jgi:two-component sensor histidine kinase
VSELSHRVKNMLAVIRAIAQQTLRQTNEPPEFAASFGGRILSMSRVHGLLSESGWQGADLHDIVRDQLAAHESLADRSVRAARAARAASLPCMWGSCCTSLGRIRSSTALCQNLEAQ